MSVSIIWISMTGNSNWDLARSFNSDPQKKTASFKEKNSQLRKLDLFTYSRWYSSSLWNKYFFQFAISRRLFKLVPQAWKSSLLPFNSSVGVLNFSQRWNVIRTNFFFKQRWTFRDNPKQPTGFQSIVEKHRLPLPWRHNSGAPWQAAIWGKNCFYPPGMKSQADAFGSNKAMKES